MNAYESTALGTFLSCWYEDGTYKQNIDALNHDDCEKDDCVLCEALGYIGEWEPFEGFDYAWLAEQIENTRESLERTFIPRNK